MEHKKGYEAARAEAWSKFYNEDLKDRPQWEPIGNRQIFDYAFKEAYRYGVMVGMEEAKAQSNSRLNHTPDTTKKIGEEVNLPARARIAAMAMQGILSNDNSQDIATSPNGDNCRDYPNCIAQYAVACADALIAELEREG